MTQQEYINKLKIIENRVISREITVSEVEQALEELNKIKPTLLYWYYVKALAKYELENDCTQAINVINGKLREDCNQIGFDEIFRLFEKIHSGMMNDFDVCRYQNILKAKKGDLSYFPIADNECKLANINAKDEQMDFAAYKQLYAIENYLAYFIHMEARHVRFPEVFGHRDMQWVRDLPNFGILNIVMQRRNIPCYVISEEWNCNIGDLLFRDLKELQIPAKHFRYEDCVENNWNVFIEEATKEASEGRSIIIIATSDILNELELSPELSAMMNRTYSPCKEAAESVYAMSVFGNYLSYLSIVYDEDCNALLNTKSEKRFSIVIPARNSADCLRYSLMTCLQQDYTGDYEIVVSDNSTGLNADVYALCKELNDPRIRYVKTPRSLHLPKSFEYAFLKTRGEFILSIGSDDGLLPWTLSTLDRVINENPDAEVIHWDRIFYAWPGFNKGQQNELLIPKKYERDKIGINHIDGLDYLARTFKSPSDMYGLPLLYINSGFKRNFMHTLLEKTGRLWDGTCQDIYIGVVCSIICPKILDISYPLAIAGMSEGSVGAQAQRAVETEAEFAEVMQKVSNDGNLGGYCLKFYENFLPTTGTDTWSLYTSILRCISIGILPELYIDQVIDWKLWYLNLAVELNNTDVQFDIKLNHMRKCAALFGEEFLTWFDEKIYKVLIKPQCIDASGGNTCFKRSYEVGETEYGGCIYDGSEHQIKNVWDAMNFVVSMLG